MGDHQQRLVATLQKAFEPLNHLQVKVVGRLVKYQEVRLRDKHIGQRHTLLLATAELSYRLVQVTYLQLGQNLLGLQHFLGVPLMVKTGVEHALLRIKDGTLLKHTHTDVAPVDDIAGVIALLTGQYGEQRRLARTVLGNQSHMLPFSNREADVVKQHKRAEGLRQSLNVKKRCVLSHFLSEPC